MAGGVKSIAQRTTLFLIIRLLPTTGFPPMDSLANGSVKCSFFDSLYFLNGLKLNLVIENEYSSQRISAWKIKMSFLTAYR